MAGTMLDAVRWSDMEWHPVLLRAAAAIASFSIVVAATSGAAQSPDGQGGKTFAPLFDGTLTGWTIENTTAGNISTSNGLLRVEGPSGWLRSERQYTDFVLRAELRFLTPDADSGIFVRAVGDQVFMRGWPGDSYQVQVRVPTTKSFLPPLGGIFRHGTPPGDTALDTGAVLKAFTGLNEWQQLEVDVRGETLIVRVNGTETTRATVVRRAGWVGIQGETGALEYRTISILAL
jgi:hypothetical protein